MELDEQELQETRNRKKKCEYCKSQKRIEENETDNIYCDIYGTFLRIQGKVFSLHLGRVIKINYCPMCGRKLV